MSKGEVVTKNLEAGLERFKAARDLGAIATNLQIEHERIISSINKMELDDLYVPDGWGIWLQQTQPEEPMYAEFKVGGYGKDRSPEWIHAGSDALSFARNTGSGPQGVAFMAKSLEWDYESNSIWAYNKGRDFRVEVNEGIRLELLDDLTGAD